MPRLDLYIPEYPGKKHFLNQLETLRKLFLKDFGVELTNSRIIHLAINELLNKHKKKVKK